MKRPDFPPTAFTRLASETQVHLADEGGKPENGADLRRRSPAKLERKTLLLEKHLDPGAVRVAVCVGTKSVP